MTREEHALNLLKLARKTIDAYENLLRKTEAYRCSTESDLVGVERLANIWPDEFKERSRAAREAFEKAEAIYLKVRLAAPRALRSFVDGDKA
jgi:predicted transcriptional regulator